MNSDRMKIEWDAVLVSALATTLDRRFHGDRVRALHLDPVTRQVALYLREGVWLWDLHPERMAFRILEARDAPPEAARMPATVRQVTAIPDDRVLEVHLRRLRGRPSRISLVLELIPNRENAMVLEGEERTIRRLLRTREEDDRAVRRGQPWAPPSPSGRAGVVQGEAGDWTRERWMELFRGVEPGERRRTLLTRVAWSSPLVVDALLGEATELNGPGAEAALDQGFGRWQKLRAAATDPSAQSPALLLGRGARTPQPYPVPLPDQIIAEAPDLLGAFARAAAEAGSADPALVPGALLERLRDELDRAQGRLERLRQEQAALSEPGPVRALGDLLLARFHEVPTGTDEVELDDFEGNRVRIPLDATLSPDANARKFYDRAARIERAGERLPDMIAEAERKLGALEALSERVESGEADREELEAALPERRRGGGGGGGGGGDDAPSLPYRLYRSSGGYEIRVGRGAARNDDLTFHHSRPNDIWMHATQVAGAHVVLRWDGDGSPPARDLAEAATLAALNSKARTSGTVPVAWTRRKYVRKPRKAPPGAVLPDRVETIFVRPDRKVEERLRVEE